MTQSGSMVDPADISTRADFASAITTLREHRGLSVRQLARKLNAPAGTLGDYFAGRHTPPVTQLVLFHALLAECGVTGEDQVAGWTAALRRVRSAPERRAPKPAPPYRGLEPFTEGDAGRFFGRADETSDILKRIQRLGVDAGPSHRILAVVGPSGSGKSSLLRAGVVAAIRDGQLDEPNEPWSCALTTPGTDPRGALRDSLTSLGTSEDAVRRVVVVDQFEEAFTSGQDLAERAAFLDDVLGATRDTVVVIGMRADFYAAAAAEPVLLPALQHAQLVVGPMTVDHVREVIVRPAADVGYGVEPGFLDLVLADLSPHDNAAGAYDAGALPLLSHALLATWDRATGDKLTIADYRASGGIDGAIQRTADELYDSLAPDARELARRVFLRLVHVDGEIAVTRRRVTHEELDRIGDPIATDAVLDAFLGRRLLTADTHTVEISHEALLTAWPRLQDWIDADRAGLRLHRQITEGANAWIDATRDASLLPRGVRLENSVEWSADPDHAAELAAVEHEYLSAGVAQRDTEQRRDRQRTRRLRRLLAAVAVLAVVAGVLAIYSAHSKNQADDASANARAARDNALSRQVAFQSRQLLTQDPALAEQLALVAYRIAPTAEARGALVDQSVQAPITRVLGVQGPTPLAVSPRGRLLAIGHSKDGTTHLYSTRSDHVPTPVGVVPGSDQQVFALAFSPDDTLLATAGTAGTVRLWNVSTPSRPTLVASLGRTFSTAVESLAFSPDGRTLVAGGGDDTSATIAWNVANPRAAVRLTVPAAARALVVTQSVAFSRDGSLIAAGGKNEAVVVWRASDGKVVGTKTLSDKTALVNVVAFGATDKVLYAGDAYGLLVSLAVPSMTVTHTLPVTTNSGINSLAVSPDGRHLAYGKSDNTLSQTDPTLTDTDFVRPNQGPATGATYSPDGSVLYWAAADGTVRLTRSQFRALPVTPTVFSLGLSRSGTRLLVSSNGGNGSLQLWNVSNPDRPVSTGPPLTTSTSALGGTGDVSPDGNLVAAARYDGALLIWNVSDPQHPRLVATLPKAVGPIPENVIFSPDGSLVGVASDDQSIALFDVRDPSAPRLVSKLKGGGIMFAVAFSKDGKLVAGADASGVARLWSIADPAHPRALATLRGFQSYVYGVAFSPDGKSLAAASADHTVRVWDIADRAHPRQLGPTLIGPTDYVYWAAFSPDGKTLAASSNDGTVRVYDLRTRSRVPSETLTGVGGPVFVTTFSRDGKYIYAAGRGTAVLTWTLNPSTIARRLCPLVGDPITRDEWALYVPGAKYDPPCR